MSSSSAPGFPVSVPRVTCERSALNGHSLSSRIAATSAGHGTCSATRESAPTATCTPSATTSSRGKARRRSRTESPSSPTCGTRSPSTTLRHTSGFGTASRGRHGPPGSHAGQSRRWSMARTFASAATFCSCAAATTAMREATPPNSPASSDSGAPLSIRRRGRKTSTMPASGSRSSAAERRP